MNEKNNLPQPPRGLSRLLWRLPILLYRVHLGWLLGERFLLLNHVGRKSGRPRQAVIEVVRYEPIEDAYYSVSGFGERADWFCNIIKTPEVSIQVGRRSVSAHAERLSFEQAEGELLDYAGRHPAAFKNLGSFLGYKLDGSDASIRALARLLPVVRLRVKT